MTTYSEFKKRVMGMREELRKKREEEIIPEVIETLDDSDVDLDRLQLRMLACEMAHTPIPKPGESTGD